VLLLKIITLYIYINICIYMDHKFRININSNSIELKHTMHQGYLLQKCMY